MSQVYRYPSRSVTRRITDPLSESCDPQTHAGEKIHGQKFQAEVRQLQSEKYSQDKVKFCEKEKEKAKKKLVEKFKRYNHVLVGQRLESKKSKNDVESARFGQQSEHDVCSPKALKLEREKEANQLKEEDKRKDERMGKHTFNTTGQRLSAAVSQIMQNTAGSQKTDSKDNKVLEKEKEERFRNEMRAAREKMQRLYDLSKN